MHIISRKQLHVFLTQHPQAEPGLTHWYTTIKAGSFNNFAELRATFPAVDLVGKVFVFNISGNTIQLIAAIHFNRQSSDRRSIFVLF